MFFRAVYSILSVSTPSRQRRVQTFPCLQAISCFAPGKLLARRGESRPSPLSRTL